MAQFQPGESGNPGGRPKAHGDLRELARKHTVAAIEKLVVSMEYGRSEKAQIQAANSLPARCANCREEVAAWGGPDSPNHPGSPEPSPPSLASRMRPRDPAGMYASSSIRDSSPGTSLAA
jgi:Family of unknown function (DUF5681)